MGRKRRILKVSDLVSVGQIDLPPGLRRRKPRAWAEWQSLREWNRIPAWEEDPAGYILRSLRHEAGLTQREMADRLGCSQQAVAQAERWAANPSAAFMQHWARVLGRRLELQFPARRSPPRAGTRAMLGLMTSSSSPG